MMKKEEFLKYEATKIHELIAERYSGDIEVRQAAVVKMNDQKLNGLSVSLDGNNVCPTIYLDDAFETYVNGTDPDRIAEDIAIQAFDAGRMAPSADTLEQLPDLSGKRLALRLLEASRNREFLKDTPYMEAGKQWQIRQSGSRLPALQFEQRIWHEKARMKREKLHR